jgi:hypothetical protein
MLVAVFAGNALVLTTDAWHGTRLVAVPWFSATLVGMHRMAHNSWVQGTCTTGLSVQGASSIIAVGSNITTINPIITRVPA